MTNVRRRVDSLMVREVDGELLLLDTSSNRIHQLNRTASFIWQHCDDVGSEAELAAELAVEFDVEEGQALNDVTKTLHTLRSLELVSEV
jgi:Coenzyme PQQ synthesis protein D (PqqD)